MSSTLDAFYASLNRPIVDRSRILLVLAVIPLALSFAQPLWQMHLRAPQYPQGLNLLIYSHTVEGDLREVNTLNHYIGMHKIDRAALSDLDWLPFALGAMILLTLRVAAIGDLRGLIDLAVMFAYFSVFSLFRFAYRLWVFGHNLDPHAPFTVEGFMPPVLGTAQIANFTTTSLPAAGSWLLAVFAVALVAALVWNLHAQRSG